MQRYQLGYRPGTLCLKQEAIEIYKKDFEERSDLVRIVGDDVIVCGSNLNRLDGD